MLNEPSFTELHQALIDRYDLEELRTLCARLGVPFDDLRGEGRSAKARELILWLQRRSRLDELIAAFASQEETEVEVPFAPAPELLARAQEQEDRAEEEPSAQQRTTMTEQAGHKYDVFISYSHADRAWVRDELLPRLEGAGLRVCIDDRDFEIGVPSLINMERAVDDSRHTLVVLTPAWIESQWTEFESLLAGTADPAGRRRKLIPLMLKSCKLPPRISMLTYADFTRSLEREAQMTRLVRSLGSATETLSHPESSKKRPHTVTAPNPFGDRGRITDPDRFFDREELLRQIFEELGKGVNLSLVGESQIGKSSLLSMVCALGPERMGRPPETFAYLSLEWVDDESDFYEALCDALGIETCRGYQLTRALRDKRYVLCLDEIEKMTWDGFTMHVRSQLRGLADGPAAPLKLVIASRSPLAYLFPDSTELTSPLAGICHPLDVGPFPPDVAREFLDDRLRSTSVSFTESEIATLLEESGSHPAKLQHAAADLYNINVKT